MRKLTFLLTLKDFTMHTWQIDICLGYVQWTSIDPMKEHDFTLTKVRSRMNPTEMITGADDADDLLFLENTYTQAESLANRLKRAARGNGLDSFKFFLSRCAISLFKRKPLKLEDQLIHLGSNISSTERDVNIFMRKAWPAIYRLRTIWKSDFSDKIKR